MRIKTMQIALHETANVGICNDQDVRTDIRKYFENNDRKLWNIFPVDMGCVIIAKHDGTHSNQPIHIFFMHSDMWGQYGDDNSSVQDLVEFVPEDYVCQSDCEEMEGFINDKRAFYRTPLPIIKTIKCPTCRKPSQWDSGTIPIRFQTADGEEIPKCIICCVNDVSIVLNECGHCTLCKECALRI